jgi:hypothetical protein
MVRAFQILAVALIAAAAYFLMRAEYDDAFVTGVLGICSFFLSVRFTFKPRIEERLAARQNVRAEADDQTAAKSEQE